MRGFLSSRIACYCPQTLRSTASTPKLTVAKKQPSIRVKNSHFHDSQIWRVVLTVLIGKITPDRSGKSCSPTAAPKDDERLNKTIVAVGTLFNTGIKCAATRIGPTVQIRPRMLINEKTRTATGSRSSAMPSLNIRCFSSQKEYAGWVSMSIKTTPRKIAAIVCVSAALESSIKYPHGATAAEMWNHNPSGNTSWPRNVNLRAFLVFIFLPF
jgi:hypothetical protein